MNIKFIHQTPDSVRGTIDGVEFVLWKNVDDLWSFIVGAGERRVPNAGSRTREDAEKLLPKAVEIFRNRSEFAALPDICLRKTYTTRRGDRVELDSVTGKGSSPVSGTVFKRVNVRTRRIRHLWTIKGVWDPVWRRHPELDLVEVTEDAADS